MGRPKLKSGLTHEKGIRIRMTKDEKETLKRVSEHFSKTQSDIVRCALSWYYGQILSEAEFNYIVNGGNHHE